MNQIRALRLCLLLTDNLITIFLLSSFIAIFSSFNIYPPSTSLTLSYLFLLSSVIPASALHLHFTFTVAHPNFLKWFCWTQRQCWENWTGRHILSMGWVKGSFLLIRIFRVKLVVLMNTTQNHYGGIVLGRHYCWEIRMMLAVSKNHTVIRDSHLSRVELTTLCTRWWAANTNRCIIKDVGVGLSSFYFFYWLITIVHSVGVVSLVM